MHHRFLRLYASYESRAFRLLTLRADYLPVYFQACQLASPTRSGVDMLAFAIAIAPISMAAGISITVYQCYRPQLWISWVLILISTGLFTTLKADTFIWNAIGYSIIGGAGLGIAYTATNFPVLAPLPVSANASAIALFIFLRIFGQVRVVF